MTVEIAGDASAREILKRVLLFFSSSISVIVKAKRNILKMFIDSEALKRC